MQILKSIDDASASGKTKQIFEGLHKALGVVPNMTRAMANSPAALDAYVRFDAALAAGTLPRKTHEQIAIAVAEANACDYCLSAHTVLGGLAGLTPDDLNLAHAGQAADAKTNAALQFALKIVKSRGRVAPADVQAVHAAGYTDGEVAEIVGAVALNIFTNYFNNVAGTDIDFPVVRSTQSASSPSSF
jgi:uncharacterized peroxidase-related enzyme